LSVFLTLLLLADSTLALEITTHENMSHMATLPVAMQHDGPPPMIAAHKQISEPDLAILDVSEQTEECICDELCCVSSLNLINSSAGLLLGHLKTSGSLQALLYQSINLDLLRPPPIR